ncbi:hypothetical protein [Chitinophaga sp.]|uniref:hypothetical protein n=1 Tax=Chitinophaga sp. TaxID=1869181 RepID=UPI0031D4693F
MLKFSWLTWLLILSVALKALSHFLPVNTVLSHALSGMIADILLLRVIIMVVTTVKKYRILAQEQPEQDFMERIPAALQGVISVDKAREMLSSEIAVVYYMLTGTKSPQDKYSFSYHKFGGIISVYIVFIFLLFIEGAATTILLHKLSLPIVERILLVLSVYSIIFLIAHIRAMQLRPVTVHEDTLVLRYGLLTTITIPVSNILKIETDKKSYNKRPEAVKLALLSALEQHNMKLELVAPIELKLLFKKKTGIRIIYFRVDVQEQFCVMIQEIKNS